MASPRLLPVFERTVGSSTHRVRSTSRSEARPGGSTRKRTVSGGRVDEGATGSVNSFSESVLEVVASISRALRVLRGEVTAMSTTFRQDPNFHSRCSRGGTGPQSGEAAGTQRGFDAGDSRLARLDPGPFLIERAERFGHMIAKPPERSRYGSRPLRDLQLGEPVRMSEGVQP